MHKYKDDTSILCNGAVDWDNYKINLYIQWNQVGGSIMSEESATNFSNRVNEMGLGAVKEVINGEFEICADK